MFDAIQYKQNSLSLFFERQPDVRRKANMLEDIVRDTYLPPLTLPVPDDHDPEQPRIIFSSKTGHSQIVLTQVSVALTVQYSPDFAIDISRGRRYLLERVPLLTQVVTALHTSTMYCGFTTTVQMPSTAPDRAIIDHVAKVLLRDTSELLYDIDIKRTYVRDDRYYSNIALSNYRSWNIQFLPQMLHVPLRLVDTDIAERGLQVIGDYNDRYAYNQQRNYRSSRDVVRVLIDQGLREVATAVQSVQGASEC